MIDTTERHKVVPAKVKGDDLMAFITYAKVKAVSGDGLHLIVTDTDGREISIKGKDLIEGSFSANQYEEEKKVNKTEAAQILINAHNRPLTVCFLKADGSERVLRGRLIAPEPLLGRSMVEDLDVDDKKNRFRQVDHRTIEFLIVDGVKYVVK
jgi:hypothetical protein